MILHPLSYSLILVIFTSTSYCQAPESWSSGLNALLRNCSPKFANSNPHKPFLDILRQCLQRRALIALDAVLSDDVIPVVNGIDLVRYKETNLTDKDVEARGINTAKTWKDIVFTRFGRIFRTHVLRINIETLLKSKNGTDDAMRESSGDISVEGRRRHHRRRHQHLMPMMMMGLLIMGSVLIPMGFQFLAVLGGKALILAKLALMLSSIQGLKKIATNGVNYGLYHTPVADGWHERSHHESLGHYEVPYQGYQRP
ncbi:uncharacterized protein LOC135163892 [Diachasmimorpha longicaudata]|uniref:uncharacterized protein LOC135163892 n=1 Tax=Diachasmimorpha longicaudata TaxID=58733 RepID=UPI0030B87009